MPFQSSVGRGGFGRYDASGAVEAQHRHRVACGDVGGHAVAAIEFFAALALLHVSGSHNSTADSTFILQDFHLELSLYLHGFFSNINFQYPKLGSSLNFYELTVLVNP